MQNEMEQVAKDAVRQAEFSMLTARVIRLDGMLAGIAER
ncbi:MAG: hypothetical protein ACI8R4_003226 [Paracoccaceae bacterium]|jgi:hypothetical protein